MLIKRKEICLLIMQTCFLVCVVLFSVVPLSCKVSTSGIEIQGGNFEPPVLQNIEVISDKSICLQFSDSVTLQKIVVSKSVEGISDSTEHSSDFSLSPSLSAACGEYGYISCTTDSSDNNKKISILLDTQTEIGQKYEVFGCVEDESGNSLTFCVPFIGYNSFIPQVIINEAQVKYGKGSVNGETVYRAEFVELLVLEDGNLAGLELISACDGEEKKFVFPPINVKSGEIILVHPRTKESGCINEEGDDLDLAFAPHSKNGIRDLWSQNEESCYNDSSDIIYIKNSIDSSILDAFVYVSSDMTEWKENVQNVLNQLISVGICESDDISIGVISKGVSPLKSFSRKNGKEILDQISSNDEYNFPVKFNADNWEIMSASAGVL